MGIDRTRPVRPVGTRSRASKDRKAKKTAHADAKAMNKFRTVKWLLDLLEEDSELSMKDAIARLNGAIAAGVVTGLTVPSYSTLTRWLGDARNVIEEEERPLEIGDCRPGSRPGRPRSKLPDEVRIFFEDQILLQHHASIAGLIRTVQDWAGRNGHEVPSSYVLRDRYGEIDPALISAARHGGSASRMDAIPHFAVAPQHTHDTWTLDEKHCPVWLRHWDSEAGWISVAPALVLLADNRSNAILAYHVTEPFKGGSTKAGFDADDVIGTFLSAALPDLAAAGCEAFSGHLPESLRLDRAPQHNALKSRARQIGIHAADLPGNSPANRGSIERVIGILAELLHEVPGHRDHWVPIDQLKGAEAARRVRAAATDSRRARRQPIEPQDLLTREGFTEILGEAVQQYNTTVNRVMGCTPEAAYFRHFDQKKARNGGDALLMLQPRILTVGKGGIEHRNVTYLGMDRGQLLELGQQLECRPDPLGRALFAKTDKHFVALPPVREAAAGMAPEDVARIRGEKAARYSLDAEEVRQRYHEALVGRDRAELTQHTYRAKVDRRSKGRKRSPAAPKQDPEPVIRKPVPSRRSSSPTIPGVVRDLKRNLRLVK